VFPIGPAACSQCCRLDAQQSSWMHCSFHCRKGSPSSRSWQRPAQAAVIRCCVVAVGHTSQAQPRRPCLLSCCPQEHYFWQKHGCKFYGGAELLTTRSSARREASAPGGSLGSSDARSMGRPSSRPCDSLRLGFSDKKTGRVTFCCTHSQCVTSNLGAILVHNTDNDIKRCIEQRVCAVHRN
jgi:hypothetical protein